MKNLAALMSGIIFAIGLAISGMTQPHKVIGFLDVFGDWDPSLMFVMVGAIVVHAISYRLIRIRKTPLFETRFHISEETKITRSLLCGALLFGAGWGLGGYCPGPALASMGTGDLRPLVFVFSMATGMLIFLVATRRKKS